MEQSRSAEKRVCVGLSLGAGAASEGESKSMDGQDKQLRESCDGLHSLGGGFLKHSSSVCSGLESLSS